MRFIGDLTYSLYELYELKNCHELRLVNYKKTGQSLVAREHNLILILYQVVNVVIFEQVIKAVGK